MARRRSEARPAAPKPTALEVARDYLNMFPTPEEAFRRFEAPKEASYRKALDRFARRFAESPHEAFVWCHDAVQAAARLEVHRWVISALDGGATLAQVVEGLADDVRLCGNHVPSSSSPTSNDAEQHLQVARVELLDRARDWLQSHEKNVGIVYAESEGW